VPDPSRQQVVRNQPSTHETRWSFLLPSIRRVLFAALAAVALVVIAISLAMAALQEARHERQLLSAIIERIQVQVDGALRQLLVPVERQLLRDLERVRRERMPRGDASEMLDTLLPPMRLLDGVQSMMLGDATGYQLLVMQWSEAVLASPLLQGVADLPPAPPAGVEQFFVREVRRAAWGPRSEWTLFQPDAVTVQHQWQIDLPDYDPRQRPWFVRALDRLAEVECSPPEVEPTPIVWTDVYELFTTKTPGLSVSAAARAPDGAVQVVAYDLLLDDLDAYVASLSTTPTGRTFLCRSDGVFLASPSAGAGTERRHLQPIESVGAAPEMAWAQRWRARDSVERDTFQFDADGELWWGAWHRFQVLGSAPLWLGVVMPRRELLDLVGSERIHHFALLLGALGLALLLATAFAWRIARPLREVVVLSERIGALDLDDGPTPESRIVELRQLITTLEATRRALREHIEARGRAAQALALGEDRYRTTVELAAVGIAHVDLEHRFTVANEHLCRILGRSRAELLTECVDDLVHEGDREEFGAMLRAIVAGSTSEDIGRSVVRWIGPKGQTVQVEVGVRLLRDAGAAPSHFVMAVSDLTERASLEERLRQAQRLEAVGRLAGGVAHDFNNLLTGILGHLSVARELSPPTGDLAEELRSAENAVASGAVLVRQLLAFARREATRPRIVDVGVRLQNSATLLRRLIDERIRLHVVVAEGSHRARIDPTQLEQIVVNLVLNARDAIDDEGMITIDVTADERDGRRFVVVVVVVADDGSGMTPDVLDRAFDPFFTTKGPAKGTGLGLASCFAIVEGAGGSISISSEPQVGTRVRFELPATDAPVDEGDGDPATKAAAARGETVLCVEDEPAIRRIIERALKARGYRVLLAASGEEALAIVAGEQHIDLLVTDLRMPGLQGDELARRIVVTHPVTRVLLMSGYADPGVAERNDAFAMIAKPYTPDELLQRVREVLDAAPRQKA
jgi:two-component system, cell cycle sensor histidine kinase and response regulator CckA